MFYLNVWSSITYTDFMFNCHHSYVLSVYCFTLVLSRLSSFYFFVYCVFYVWLPVLAK